jgi:hypothetical protein
MAYDFALRLNAILWITTMAARALNLGVFPSWGGSRVGALR